MAEASLSCYTRREGRTLVTALEGCLDVATAPQAIEFFQRFSTENGPEIVVDTSRLDFIDSRGVGALLSAAKSARDQGGYLYLPEPALPVRRILETCGLMSLFAAPPPRPEPAAAETPPAEAAPAPRAKSSTPRASTARVPRKAA